MKHKDFSKSFLCVCDFIVLSGWRFRHSCLDKKNGLLQVKAGFVCSIRLNFLLQLIVRFDSTSLPHITLFMHRTCLKGQVNGSPSDQK